MPISKRLPLYAALAALPLWCHATGTSLGRPVSVDAIAGWDISISPSGAGLPAGGGNAAQGAVVFAQKCQACHGEKGIGKPADTLVGGIGSLPTAKPLKTIGSYWPYATTLFDYVRRAMPYDKPKSLSNEEVYAVAAYLLWLNGIIGERETMDARSLPKVLMPNRDGFVNYWPEAPRPASATSTH